MKVAFSIRGARLEDSEAACIVLRRSIAELCHVDHRNDEKILERWLANKTPEFVRAWITAPESHVFVACSDDEIVGVGAITRDGLVTLNYVVPEFRFQGVSKALIARLERQAKDLGLKQCVLETTETARKFYRNVGYAEEHKISQSKRMSKRI